MTIVQYRCAHGHMANMRTTTLRPDPDRWGGIACGYCARNGTQAMLYRVITAHVDPYTPHSLGEPDYSRDHIQ